jgi:hypothetical protein
MVVGVTPGALASFLDAPTVDVLVVCEPDPDADFFELPHAVTTRLTAKRPTRRRRPGRLK